MKISYNWLKRYLPEIPEPKRLEELFTYHLCEVESVTPFTNKDGEKDWIFDLGILPNRAHDLLSHHGVAKELAGLLGIEYKDPSTSYKIPASTPTKLVVKASGSRRYMARIIRNVKISPSPEWVVKHLESIGQRSINNVVDATNIVMYDCGQPTHAFDLDKIKGAIVVRDAKNGETMTLLDGKEVILDEKDVVISDDNGVLALAGVKGGKRAEVTNETKNILIEVANFFPVLVRRTARRLGILTDSAKRFENDLSPELCDFAMTELSGLFVEYGCTDFEDIVDVYPFDGFKNKKKIQFSASYINKMLGIKISEKEIEKIMKNYGYEYKKENDIYTIEVPLLRFDLENKEDIVEEIGRVYGYDKVVPILPKINLPTGEIGFTPKENEIYIKIKKVHDALVELGYKEVMTYAFANTGDVEVLASASDKKFLRTNLADGLKKSYEMNKLNAPLLGLSETSSGEGGIKIFEIGTVFKNNSESINVAWADKKEIKEMTLEKFANEKFFPSEETSHSLTNSEFFKNLFKMWSLYPFITRDIAVWVKEGIAPEVLIDIYKDFGTELLINEPYLFDSFTKNGRTSYAYRLIFQSYDKTLMDEEINIIMSNITKKIVSLGWEVR